MKRIALLSVIALAVAVSVFAQTAAAPAQPAASEPLSRAIFAQYSAIKRNLTESAEKVGTADYEFAPTKDVRNFAQMFDHIANTQFTYCAIAKAEANPNKDDFEKTATTKAAVIKALADSFAYCDTVYSTLTDSKAMELIKSGQNEVPRVSRLISNIAHNNEHYGNLVTMMRLKGMVPPSTERSQAAMKK